MNFKPNLLKCTVSFIAGIFTDFLLAGTVKVQCSIMPMANTSLPPYFCPQPSWLDFAFDPVPIVVSLIVIILTYIVLSLIPKKEARQK